MSEFEILDTSESLVDLLGDPAQATRLHRLSVGWPSWTLTPVQLCELELLATGAFSPLAGFLGRADLASVCERMRLADGTLWPIPVMLDVNDEVAPAAEKAGSL